jgi:CheY-like chemotaxis protein
MIEKFTPRILVLDDEPFMLRVISQTLARLGFSLVTGCGSGRAALERVDNPKNSPDIILCDLNMPQMNGFEFLNELVDRHYNGSLILISGDRERMLQMFGKLAQAHQITLLGHLRKPVPPAALAALLELWSPAL